MADIVSPEKRSRMMSGIKGKHTKPEMLFRKRLFARGFRFRLHDARFPGKPDLVFSQYRTVLFVNGCFWHGHDCHLYKRPPSTRTEFWEAKINRNRENDIRNSNTIFEAGWTVITVWECALRGKKPDQVEALLDAVADRIRGGGISGPSQWEFRDNSLG